VLRLVPQRRLYDQFGSPKFPFPFFLFDPGLLLGSGLVFLLSLSPHNCQFPLIKGLTSFSPRVFSCTFGVEMITSCSDFCLANAPPLHCAEVALLNCYLVHLWVSDSGSLPLPFLDSLFYPLCRMGCKHPSHGHVLLNGGFFGLARVPGPGLLEIGTICCLSHSARWLSISLAFLFFPILRSLRTE